MFKRIGFALLFLLSMLSIFGVEAEGQTTAFSASQIQDGSGGGNLLASGQLCIVGTNSSYTPTPFHTGAGGMASTTPHCVNVTNGAVPTFNVASSASAAPNNLNYTITVTDSVSGETVITLTGVQINGASFSLDSYASLPPLPSTATSTGPLTVNGDLTATGSYIGNAKFAGQPWYDVTKYGAACDGTTNDYSAISSALSAAIAAGAIVKLPAGKTCAYGTTLSIASGNFAIQGGSGAVLKYTGTGTDAILIDGHLTGVGARNVELRDFAIDAASATNCLHTIALSNSEVNSVRCTGAIGTGFLNEGPVVVHFIRPVVSVNDAPFSHTPATGFVIANYGSNNASDNELLNPVIEGVSGDGIQLTNASATLVLGGTSEGNHGRGLYISGNSDRTTLINVDLEVNSGACSSTFASNCDIEVASAGTRQTRFVNLVVQNNVLINGAPKETTFDGGLYNNITVLSGAQATAYINGVRYNTLNDSGLGSNRFGWNATISNLLATTQFKGNPILSNDTPLEALSSSGTQYHVLWWTAADQTLIQYLQGSALKIRNTNGLSSFVVTDGGVAVTSLNQTVFADQQAGADMCAKIQAAHNALASVGGIIDATGLNFSQSCAATVAFTKPVRLKLGVTTLNLTASLFLTTTSNLSVEGVGNKETRINTATGGGIFGFASSANNIQYVTIRNVFGYGSASGSGQFINFPDCCTGYNFANSRIILENNTIQNFNTYAVNLGVSAYSFTVRQNSFFGNNGSVSIGYAADGTIQDNQFYNGLGSNPSMQIVGGSIVEISGNAIIQGGSQTGADIELQPNAATGRGGNVFIHDNKFGPENETSTRYKIRTYYATNATYISTAVSLANNTFGCNGGTAIRFDNPQMDWRIKGNQFSSCAVLVDDAFAQPNADFGHSIFTGNTLFGLFAAKVFTNGGKGFSEVSIPEGATGPAYSSSPREYQSKEVRNRLAYSEALNSWTLGTYTATTGQADPWGTTRAVKLSRANLAAFENVTTAIDSTNLTGNIVVKFWGLAGTASKVRVGVYDNTSSSFVAFDLVALDSTWRPYTLHVRGMNTAHTFTLYFYLNDTTQTAGDATFTEVEVSDYDSSYVATNGAAYSNAALDANFDRGIKTGTITIAGGGSLSGTFSGNPTLSGTPTFNAGGTFAGSSFGSATKNLYSTYWTGVNSNPAASGSIRLSTGDIGDCWRNFGNTADLCLSKNSSDQFLYNGNVVVTSNSPAITSPTITGGEVLNGATSGSTTLQASAAAAGVITLPSATDTLVGRATIDTLTNKTLTSPAETSPAWSGTPTMNGTATFFSVAADFTTAASTSLQTITGLTWNLAATTAQKVPFSCHLAYSQATALAAVAFGIQSATIAPNQIFATGAQYTSATAATGGVLPALITTTATNIVSATPSVIGTNYMVDIDGIIDNPSNASANTINIMVSTATAADAVTVKKGSYCRVF